MPLSFSRLWRLTALVSFLMVAVLPGAAQTNGDASLDFLRFGSGSRGSLRSVLRPIHDLQLSARAAGIIERFVVAEGSPVQAGEPILILNAEQEKAEVLQAEAMVRGARAEMERAAAEFERIKPLSEERIYSDKQLFDARAAVELARSRFEQAEASLMGAKSRLADRTLLSPISGVFLKTNKSVGEAVERFETIARVIDVSTLEMVVYCDSQYFSTFQSEEPVRIKVLKTAENQPLVVGKIVHVDPIIDPASGTFRVKIQVRPSADAAPGYTALLIPPSA